MTFMIWLALSDVMFYVSYSNGQLLTLILQPTLLRSSVLLFPKDGFARVTA